MNTFYQKPKALAKIGSILVMRLGPSNRVQRLFSFYEI